MARRRRGASAACSLSLFFVALWATSQCGARSFLASPAELRARRRDSLSAILVATFGFSQRSLAEEPFNPLKLKGYVWETGKLSDTGTLDGRGWGQAESSDLAVLLGQLNDTIKVFESLEANLPQESFEQLKTQLRGASFSELWLKSVMRAFSEFAPSGSSTCFLSRRAPSKTMTRKEINAMNAAVDAATLDFGGGPGALIANEAERANRKYNYLVVSCSDLTLSFFDVDNALKLARRLETKTAQLVLCWSEVAQVLFSADHEGRILAWDISSVRSAMGRVYESGQGDPWRDFVKWPNCAAMGNRTPRYELNDAELTAIPVDAVISSQLCQALAAEDPKALDGWLRGASYLNTISDRFQSMFDGLLKEVLCRVDEALFPEDHRIAYQQVYCINYEDRPAECIMC
eukprot:s213_g1.t3